MKQFCFLFGHRDAPEWILPQIERAVEAHYRKYYVREFVVGRRGNFDAMAVQAVRTLKEKHPRVRLTRLLAYPPDTYGSKVRKMGNTYYPDGMEDVPIRLAVMEAGQRVIDGANSVICYANRPGDARKLMEYARKTTGEARVENLGVG